MTSLYLTFVMDAFQQAPKKTRGGFNPQTYMGTKAGYLGISNPIKYTIARNFKKTFPDITFPALIQLLDTLNTGETFEEKTIGPFILDRYNGHLAQITPHHLARWLNNLQGWCEIDTLSQSNFDATHMLLQWTAWKKALRSFSHDPNISKRRASLVLLCHPLRTSDDPRIRDLAFANIQQLTEEKDILITKAVSWVLREMTKHFSSDVYQYLNDHLDTLPKIAIRETRKKLETGRKT